MHRLAAPALLLAGCPDPTCPPDTRFLHGACVRDAAEDADTDADSDSDTDADADTDVPEGPWVGSMMARMDPARTARYPGAAPGAGEIAWQADLGDACVTPSASEGQVYAATTAGVVHALELKTGLELWSFDAHSAVGTPAIADRRVIFGNRDGDVDALASSNGQLLWSQLDGVDACGPVAASDDAVHVACGSLYALSPEDGSIQLSAAVEDATPLQGPTVLPTLVALGGGPLHAYDRASLTEVWASEVAKTLATPSTDGENLWLPTQGGMVEIGTNQGGITWTEDAFATLEDVSPALADGVVYLATTRAIRAREAKTGNELWSALLPAEAAYGLAVVGDAVFAVDTAGTVYAIGRSDGEIRWTLPVGACAAPAAADGLLFVGTSTGVVALR